MEDDLGINESGNTGILYTESEQGASCAKDAEDCGGGRAGDNENQTGAAKPELIADKKKKRTFQFFLLLFSIVAIAVLAVIEFTGDQHTEPFGNIAGTWLSNWNFLLMAFVCLLAVLFFEALAVFLLIGRTSRRWRPKLSLKVTCLGRYWDNITPSAIGGQPYQIYYLYKYQVSAGAASSVPVVFLFFRQLSLVLMSYTAFIFAGSLVSPVILAAAVLGATIMFLLPVGILFFTFMPKLATGIVVGILKILHKLRIVKDLEKSKSNIIGHLEEYIRSIKSMGKHVWFLLLTFVLALAAQAAMMAVPYFIIRASGHDADLLSIIALALFTSCAVSFIPTPGSSGAAESIFYIVFGMFEGGFVFWCMLLWRFITYYLPTLIGLGISLNDYIKRLIRDRRAMKAN